MQRADRVTWTKPNRWHNNIIISIYAVLSLPHNSKEEWVGILWGEFFLVFSYRSKLERKKSSVMCSVTKLFYSRPGKKSENYFPAPTLSKPEQSIDNKKTQQGQKTPDGLNYVNPELWWWICKIWKRILHSGEHIPSGEALPLGRKQFFFEIYGITRETLWCLQGLSQNLIPEAATSRGGSRFPPSYKCCHQDTERVYSIGQTRHFSAKMSVEPASLLGSIS